MSLLLSFKLWALSFGTARAETLQLTPVADTALLENFPSNNFGGQAWFNCGTTQNYTKNRGLVRFDIAGALPHGAKIVSAALTLEVTRAPVDGDLPSTFDLHRVLQDWGEGQQSGDPPQLGAPAGLGEANWTHRKALTTNAWAIPGGASGIDYAGASSADSFVYGVDFSPYAWGPSEGMAADVQVWLDEPEKNFGWMLISQLEASNFSARRFASREDPFRMPRLTVDYVMPRFEAIQRADGAVTLRFQAEGGWAYAVEYCVALNGEPWLTLTNVAPAESTRMLSVHDPISRPQCYYRLRVP